MAKAGEQTERKKKGEHLFKRGVTWYGWVNIAVIDPATGRRERWEQVKRSLGTPSIVRAREELAAWEAEQADPAAARLKSATLGDAWDLHEADRKALVIAGKRSKASVEFYDMVQRSWTLYAGRRLAKVDAAVRDDDLDKARKLELRTLGRSLALLDFDRAFRDGFVQYRREQGRSEHTIAKNLTEMRSALYLAKVAGKWSGDLDLVFPPFESGYEPERVVFSHDQARKLLGAFNSLPHHPSMIAFALATGAEEQAILRARREELSMVPVPLHGTKARDRERSAFQVFEWQHELMKVARAGMDGSDGFAFKEWKNSSRDLADACDALSIPVVSLHGLRHVFGAWSLDDGIAATEVAKALGHADLRQLMRTYDNRDPHVMQRRAEEQAAARRQIRLVALPGGKASSRR